MGEKERLMGALTALSQLTKQNPYPDLKWGAGIFFFHSYMLYLS
jgi:hypothetical protein